MIWNFTNQKKNKLYSQIIKVKEISRTICIHKKRPDITNHINAKNPYKSKYGDDWLENIKKVKQLNKYVCITGLIKHIYEESRRIMQGTIYEDNWYFYHDSLSLITCAECIEWRKKEVIYKHWLLPREVLNEGTDYSDKPNANSMEFIPLDCSLFQDIYLALSRHMIYTGCLDKNDPKKISFSSLKK